MASADASVSLLSPKKKKKWWTLGWPELSCGECVKERRVCVCVCVPVMRFWPRVRISICLFNLLWKSQSNISHIYLFSWILERSVCLLFIYFFFKHRATKKVTAQLVVLQRVICKTNVERKMGGCCSAPCRVLLPTSPPSNSAIADVLVFFVYLFRFSFFQNPRSDHFRQFSTNYWSPMSSNGCISLRP